MYVEGPPPLYISYVSREWQMDHTNIQKLQTHAKLQLTVHKYSGQKAVVQSDCNI